MFLLFVLVLTVFFYYFYIKPQRYWKGSDVPFDKTVPLFGHMLKPMFKKQHFLETVQNMYNKYSGSRYFGLFNFHSPILVIKDPELIKSMTVKDFLTFPCHSVLVPEDVDSLLSKNLFAIQDLEKWRQIRATLSPTFTPRKIKAMFDIMQSCAENFTDHYLKQEKEIIEVDIKDAFRLYATDIIATTAFGISCNSLEDNENEFYLMGRDIATFSGARAFRAFFCSNTPKLAKWLGLRIIDDKIANFFRQVIKGTIRMREEQGIVRPDMVQLLLDARKRKNKKEKVEQPTENNNDFLTEEESELVKKEEWLTKITDEDITAQAVVFFLGGFETTSTTMSFAVAELAVNPNVQKKLFEEVREVYERCKGKPTYEDIQHMKYLDMVVSETLRKWGVVVVDRQVVKPYTILDEHGEPSVQLKKGDTIWIPSFSIHRDPNYYPDPDKFEPERFSEERKNEINPFTYLPFGAGPRSCIGSRFALLEIKVTIFHIVLNFELVPTPKIHIPLRMDEKYFTVEIKGGFEFGLKKR